MNAATAFEFRAPPHVLFGPGASSRVAETLDKRRAAPGRVFVVTDAGCLAAGVCAVALTALETAGFDPIVFDGVIADPPEGVVLAASAQAERVKPDAVIGLGGGSAMDVAKLVAVRLTSDQALDGMYGVDKVRGARLTPLVQIPTTAGTGSEATPIAIVTTGETTKMGVVSPQLYADAVILDPNLTLGLPAEVTAATGIDAMVHAIEAYTTKLKKNPVSDALAKESLRLLNGHLARACADGSDLDARGAMLLGAFLAGQAFANAPCAAVHALAYPLGGRFHIPHGLSNALVLPHVLRFNADVAAPLYAELAVILTPDARGDAQTLSEAVISHLAALSREVGIPSRLRDMGISHNHLPQLAEDAMQQTRLLQNNPKEVQLQDAKAIYEHAW